MSPGNGANCINWIAGHIVASRDRLLEMMSARSGWSAANGSRYGSGSSPVMQGTNELQLSELTDAFTQTTERLMARLSELTDEDIAGIPTAIRPSNSPVERWLLPFR